MGIRPCIEVNDIMTIIECLYPFSLTDIFPDSPDNDFIAEILLSQYFVQQGFYIMPFLPIQIHIDPPIFAQQSPQEDEPLSQKLKKHRSRNLVLICLLILASPKFLPCGKRWINIDQSYSWSPVSILEFTPLFHQQEGLQHLKVISENEHIRPTCVALTVSEGFNFL